MGEPAFTGPTQQASQPARPATVPGQAQVRARWGPDGWPGSPAGTRALGTRKGWRGQDGFAEALGPAPTWGRVRMTIFTRCTRNWAPRDGSLSSSDACGWADGEYPWVLLSMVGGDTPSAGPWAGRQPGRGRPCSGPSLLPPCSWLRKSNRHRGENLKQLDSGNCR